jgi:hypothetical protein
MAVTGMALLAQQNSDTGTSFYCPPLTYGHQSRRPSAFEPVPRCAVITPVLKQCIAGHIPVFYRLAFDHASAILFILFAAFVIFAVSTQRTHDIPAFVKRRYPKLYL